jgi:hypothetical protein
MGCNPTDALSGNPTGGPHHSFAMGPIPRSLLRLGWRVGACLQAMLVGESSPAFRIACKQAPTKGTGEWHEIDLIKCPGACSGDLYLHPDGRATPYSDTAPSSVALRRNKTCRSGKSDRARWRPALSLISAIGIKRYDPWNDSLDSASPASARCAAYLAAQPQLELLSKQRLGRSAHYSCCADSHESDLNETFNQLCPWPIFF